MDKFGVDEDESADKLAAESAATCPACGNKLRPISETGVLLCPKCGSKPFEHTGGR